MPDDDVLGRPKQALQDRYVIERELGAGGMATVCLAHDVTHERNVAIKVMHSELSAIHSLAILSDPRFHELLRQINLECEYYADETHRCWGLGTQEQRPQS